jgi:hypothetical protein
VSAKFSNGVALAAGMLPAPGGDPTETLTLNVAPAGALLVGNVISLAMPLMEGNVTAWLCESGMETLEPVCVGAGCGATPPPLQAASSASKTNVTPHAYNANGKVRVLMMRHP